MTAAQLRKSVLQMAVQGRLVPQNPADEPASVLLERIRREKEQLVRNGKIKKPKNESIILRGSDKIPGTQPGRFYEKTGNGELIDITDELPFEIPESWEWCKLHSISTIARGGSPRPIKRYLTTESDGINWIKIGDTEKNSKYITRTTEKIIREGLTKSRFVKSGDLLLTNSMSFGHPFILKIDGCIHDGWLVLSDYHNTLDIDYLYYLLSSSLLYGQFCDKVSGGVVKNLNIDKVNDALIPLPPLAEQKRIAAKLEEILPKIEEYHIAEEKISKLNAAFPVSFKKSILQSAIQGQLVPQNPNDEPASFLLQKIRKEKEKLIREGKIKKPKKDSIIFRRDGSWWEKTGKEEKCIDAEIPFEIPDSWEWARLGEICSLLSGQDLPSSYHNILMNGIPYITGASNIEESQIIINRWTEKPSKIANKGDLLFVCKGSVGKFAILTNDKAHIARQLMALKNIYNINFEYILVILQYYSDKLQQAAQGIIPGISREDILSRLIPLPPLAEQKRIADKVSQLLEMERGLATVLSQ